MNSKITDLNKKLFIDSIKTVFKLLVTLLFTVIISLMWQLVFDAPQWASIMYSLYCGEKIYKSFGK